MRHILCQHYEFIINKFKAKLTTVKANKLNHAGRFTYIQSVLSYIPIYYMSIVLFSKTLSTELMLLSEDFGGQTCRKTTKHPLLPSVHGKIFAKLKRTVA